MELATLLEVLDKTLSKNRILVGFGDALGETQTRITRIGTDKEAVHNLPVHIFLLEMTMPWILR